jgi:aspartate racemase
MFVVSLVDGGLDQTGVVDEATLLTGVRNAMTTLGDLGARIVAIPCNSAHAYFDQFPTSPFSRIVNLLEEAADTSAALQARNLAILCARSLRSARAYDPYLLTRGIQPLYPESSIQILIDRWILEVMGGTHTEQTAGDFQEVIGQLLNQHDAVLLACSELCVLSESLAVPPNVINSCRVLGEATLRLAFSACATHHVGPNSVQPSVAQCRQKKTSP